MTALVTDAAAVRRDRSGVRDTWSAWSVTALGLIGLMVLGAALVETRRRGVDPASPTAIAIVLTCWLAAAVHYAWRHDDALLGRLIVIGAVAGTVGFAARTWSVAGATHDATSWSGVTADVANCAGSAVLFHLAMGLPSGRLGSLGRRAAATAGYLAAGSAFVALRMNGDGSWERFLAPAGVGVGVACGGWAMYSRYETAGTTDRRRLQWFGVAAGTVAIWSVVVTTANVLFEWPRPIGALEAAATGLLPLALATDRTEFAIRRSERWAVRALHVLVWVALVCGLLVLFVPGFVHRPRTGQRGLVAATIAALLGAAALAPMIRPWLADVADRVVHGDRHPADDALRVLNQRRARSVRLDDLLGDVVDALASGLGADWVELWQRVGTGEFERTVATPSADRVRLAVPFPTQVALLGRGIAGPDAVAVWLPALSTDADVRPFRLVPVAYSGELLALMTTQRAHGGEGFTDADQATLSEVARQLGLVLHNAHLDSTLTQTLAELHDQAAELRASRARVVAAADAERRRIERDLHDGAQQQLVALAVSLGVLRDVMRSDPAESLVMVDELRAEVQVAIDDMRAFAHGIYPPLLASRGLTEAIAAVTRRGGDGSVTFRSVGIDRYPPEVEAAVYFCCLEALQNAAKHAPGSPVEVALVVDGGWLRFSITDRGPGFGEAVESSGQGRINMADRVGAVGGTLSWYDAPGGGAVVDGSVPIG